MTTKRYEHMLTRVQEELTRLKGSVDTITKEVKGAERARVSLRSLACLVSNRTKHEAGGCIKSG